MTGRPAATGPGLGGDGPGPVAGPVHGQVGDEVDCDVLVVGFGPVGQLLAVLLAQRGWRTTVLERQPEPFPLPRAVSFDGHAARLLAMTGLGPALAADCLPAADYEVVDAAGRTLLRVPLRTRGAHGWPDATSVHQPGLERGLAARAAALPGLRVVRGQRAGAVQDRGDSVAVVSEAADGSERTTTSRWVVGCDGAGSTVRRSIGAQLVDSGFACDWLACDVLPHDPAEFPVVNLQVADPARPRVAVAAGPDVRRWEFMRLPGERPEDFTSLERTWELLGLFGVRPDRARLLRRAAYTVRGATADRWRVGRTLLAGDAAHQMPPFIGQGMCSGLRDAANLAWKLDVVLGGAASPGLLDSYEAERRPDVQQAVDLSVQLGRLICGPASDGRRDRAPAPPRPAPAPVTAPAPRSPVPTGGSPAPSLPGPLTDGVLHRDAAGAPAGPAGRLAPQGRVRQGGRTVLLDELAGPSFVLLSDGDADTPCPDGTSSDALLSRLGVVVLRLHARPRPGAPGAVQDLEAVHLSWLRALGARAVLLRPDRYVFGAAVDDRALVLLLEELSAQLTPTPSQRRPDVPSLTPA